MKRLLGSVLVLCVASITSACTGSLGAIGGVKAPVVGKNPASLLKLNLESSTEKLLSTESKHLIELETNLLERNLIWSGWIEKSDRSVYPGLWHGFSTTPKIVYFKLSPDSKFVHLFKRDFAKPAPGSDDLLDRFPVVSADNGKVSFDFAQGLPLRAIDSWISSEVVAQEIQYSFIYDFENHDEVVTFAQLAILKDTKNTTFVLRHSFRELKENDSFKKVEGENPLKLGIFPASDFSGEKAVLRRANTNKIMTWYLSANTPEQYRAAITEGILWWNQAFGREFIEVKQLKEDLPWATARANILQWSDVQTFCGQAMAFGPSDANPVTGEIYSAKVLFCGTAFEPLYDAGIEKDAHSKDEFMKHVLRWGVAHEVGHTLGFSHNFYGKHFRENENPETVTSTVMDYLHPMDVMKVKGLGKRDHALVDFLYVQEGTDASRERLQSFPMCTDEETFTVSDCNHFVPGTKSALELAEWYLERLRKGTAKNVDGRVRNALHKELLNTGSSDAVQLELLINEIMVSKLGSAAADVVANEIASFATTNSGTFHQLEPSKRTDVYSLLSNILLSGTAHPSVSNIETYLEIITAAKDFVAYQSLHALKDAAQAKLETAQTNDTATYYATLLTKADNAVGKFWN